MSYINFIQSLNPDHFWTLDNTLTDSGSVGGLTLTTYNSTHNKFVQFKLSEDTNYCHSIAGKKGYLKIPSNDEMNNLGHPERTVAGWLYLVNDNFSTAGIYHEGMQAEHFAIIMFPNNGIDIKAKSFSQGYDIQLFFDKKFKKQRKYHIAFRFSQSTDRFELFVDGKKQNTSYPNPPSTNGGTDPVSTTNNFFGDPQNKIDVGGSALSMYGVNPLYLSNWGTWRVSLTDTQIFELFEKGVIPEYTITSQADLDALANTIFDDVACAIRVDVAGDITLNANNITFKDCSIDVQYTGTGTLNWYNNNSNASIGSTPNGGTINFISTVPIKIKVLDYKTKMPIQGARVWIAREDNNLEIVNSITDANGEVNANYEYTSDINIIGHIRKYSLGSYYKPVDIVGTIKNTGLDITALMIEDK